MLKILQSACRGDSIITVSGRPAARLVPLDYAATDRTWRRVDEIDQVCGGTFDPTWLAEMEADANEEMHSMDDPWERTERTERTARHRRAEH